MSNFTIVIHGGAGVIEKKDMRPGQEKAYTDALKEVLDAGFKVLQKGGSAIDAVKAAVIILEDNTLFNAGRGSVFSRKGVQEMDAAIMDGATLAAGAVAAVSNVRNPIELAHEIMKDGRHVLISGHGAIEFALKHGIKLEPDEYFFSQKRYDQWTESRDTEMHSLDHSRTAEQKFGTVGAVACDAQGNVAAATSTGGMTNKQFNRIGDSPLIGCGTYANNNTCAISCTGHGEIFIRAVAAYDVSCLMEYKGKSLQEAMDIVVQQKLNGMEAESGGIIAVDAKGNGVMSFNSSGMYRGMRSSSGLNEVAIYR